MRSSKDVRQVHGDVFLSQAEMAEFLFMRERLSGSGATMHEAVEFFLTRGGKVRKPLQMGEAVAAFHEEMYERGRSRRTRETMRCALKPFRLQFERTLVHELPRDGVLSCLKGNGWARRTQRGYLGHLRTFLSWARSEGHVADDVTKGIVIGGDEAGEISALTMGECEALLTAASKPTIAGRRSLLGYVALGMFCGLRRAEIERLTWADVRLKEKVVVISAARAKTRNRRVVDIAANAMAWLKRDPAHKSGKRVCPAAFKEMWRDLRAAAGIERWPNNALRHTFASMHFAQHQNENLLAAQMGNSPTMVHRHYRALKTKAEARKFWKLRPASGMVAKKQRGKGARA